MPDRETPPRAPNGRFTLRDLAEPSMDLARAHLKTQMPTESASLRSLAPFGFVSKLLFAGRPNVQAVTYPGGIVRYRPELLPQTQQELDDLLAHELVHVGQGAARGTLGFLRDQFIAPDAYRDREYEQAAFAKEGARQGRRQDIALPRSH